MKYLFTLLLFIFVFVEQIKSQIDLGESLEKVGKVYAEKYLEPFTSGLGINLNSGYLGGFKPKSYSKIPIFPNIYVGVKFCSVILNDEDKYFNIAFNDFFKIPQTGQLVPIRYEVLNAPTVFGSTKKAIAKGYYRSPFTGRDTTIEQELIGGISDTRFVFLFIPQIGIGTILGTDLIFRTIPGISVGNYGYFKLFGVSLRHNIGGYIKDLPLDLAVQLGYQNFGIKDNKDNKIISANSLFAGLQFYKTFPILSVYAGAQYENYDVDINYIFKSSIGTTNISFNQQGSNNFRGIAGVTITIGPIMFNADVNFGNRMSITSGFGLGL